MKKLAVALWFVFSCSTSHAQECTASADQYIGILFDDGRCFPWRKNQEKFIANVPRCTPELKGRLEIPLLPKIVNGEFVSTKECVPNELQRGPYPRSTTLDDLKDEIDELKDEVGRLKAKGK
jgi:hypothetical protein